MPRNELLRVGSEAPDFTLPSASGEPVSLSEFRGSSSVVLFFYPKDHSPACTLEACAFRDRAPVFEHAGAVVIGISADSERSHQSFASFWKLPYLLLSDVDGVVSARYGVPRTLGLFPGRVTFLIDREGIIRHIVSSQFQPLRHAREMSRKIVEIE